MRRRENDLGRVVRERLRWLKENEGLTETAVGARCTPPQSQTYLAQVADGNVSRPPAARLAAIAVGLGLPLEELRAALERAPAPDTPPLLPRTQEAQWHLQREGHIEPEDVRDVDADFAATLYRVATEARRRRGLPG